MSESKIKMTWQHHGKSRVRVGRRWVVGKENFFSEWKVENLIESECEEAYTESDNKGIVATDTQRNTCYYVANQMEKPCSPEEYAVAIAAHFLKTYKHLSKVTTTVELKPWTRVKLDGKDHAHGFVLDPSNGIHSAVVVHERNKDPEVSSKCTGLTVLKTTQSRFEGYIKDKFTLLPECKERMMASSVDAVWNYSKTPTKGYDTAYAGVVDVLKKEFFGPVEKGVHSYSIQQTLYDMGKQALKINAEVAKISLYMPNIHFLPTPPLVKFEDNVYVPVDEPHGVIHAEISRN